MEIGVLGPLELRTGGALVELRRGRPRRLLLALVVRHGEPVSTERLIDELWEDPPQNAPNALQVLVSYLRKTMAGDDAVRIDTTDGGYRLVADRGSVDALRFDDLVDAAERTEDPAVRLAALDDALALWRGPALSEAAFDEFAEGLIVHLDEQRIRAQELRIDCLLGLGRHREVIGELRKLVAEHPLRERFHAQLMLALYRSDRQSDALRAFDAARELLIDELGVDPGPELQELHRAVLDQAATLTAPDPIGTTPPNGRPASTDPGPPVVGPPDPPGSAAATVRTPAVPKPAHPLVGRAGVAAHLVELLAGTRLVTLTGTGGAGKTRVAQEVAGQLDRDGTVVWWADLTPTHDLETVVATVAAAVGATTRPDDAGETILAHLADRTGVLVLDTCEHVVAVVAALADRLLDAAAGLTVLATSRQPLRLPAELAWPVPPLELPDPTRLDAATIASLPAVRLFCERAAAVRADFELTDQNAEAVGRICLLLDGVPLALELAAVQVAAFRPGKLLDLLDDRLRVLVDDSVTGRTHTVRATIDWSYQLLDDDERRFLTRLAAFAGSFDVDAAIVVAGHDLARDGYELLVSLTRQSLVTTTPDDRFRLLDTIRAYATEQLDPDDAAATRSRHARWFVDLAEEADRHLRGGDAEGWLADLRLEVPNLRAALEWSFAGGDSTDGARLAAALAWFWGIDGGFAEARRWLSAGLDATEPGTVAHADLLTGRGIHEASLGHLADAAADSRRAAEIYDTEGDRRGLARALLYLGVSLWGLGELDEAATTHDRCAATFRDLGDDPGFGLALVLRGRTAIDREEDDLDERLDTALAITRRGGDPHVIGLCLDQRARVALLHDDLDLAVELARASLERNDGVGYVEGSIASMHALGLALAARGSTDDADGLHRDALALAVELDHPGAIAEGLECLALLRARLGDDAGALTLVAAADAVRERRTVPRPPFYARLLVAPVDAATRALGTETAAGARRAGRVLDPRALASRTVTTGA